MTADRENRSPDKRQPWTSAFVTTYMTAAALASAACALAANGVLTPMVGRGLALLTAIGCGVFVYSGVAVLLGIPEARTILARLRRRGQS